MDGLLCFNESCSTIGSPAINNNFRCYSAYLNFCSSFVYSYHQFSKHMTASPSNPHAHALHLAIIGGGFCGMMTVVHLLKKSKAPLHITVIHANNILATGIAYDTYTDAHVLNVQARNMSAFPDQPNHFVDWCLREESCRQYAPDELPSLYLPRNLYGKYLLEVYKNALTHIPKHINLYFVHAEAEDLKPEGDHLRISCSDKTSVLAHKVVLATGNLVPGSNAIPEKSFLKSPNYFGNPWEEKSVSDLDGKLPVFIVGTGLTMVDVVLGLREKKFAGKIIALSPKGFNILAHRAHHPQRDILDELAPPYQLDKLFRLFRKYVKQAWKHGESGETVVDAVRSKTQEIWQQLSIADKKRFMSHVRHLWGLARHRLPGQLHEQISGEIKEGKLEIVAGRILNITEENDVVKVTLRRRKDQQTETVEVARVINCTGPQTDITKTDKALFVNLLKKGTLVPDEMKLGIYATAEGRILHADGIVSNRMFTLGTSLKGRLWESTAVPELRVQAAKLADILLED